MSVYIKVNGAAADTHLISMSADSSVAERLPVAQIVVDNSGNLGIGLYHSFDVVEVWFGSRGAEQRIFKGYIEDIDQNHERRNITLTCRGYAVLLADAMIDIISYSGKTSSYIVDNLRSLYGKDGDGVQIITGTNIHATTDSITRSIKGAAAWDAILDLAVDLGYDAWVDDNADLHFTVRAFADCGVTINTSSKVFSVSVGAKASQAINKVIVYGGGSPQVVGVADDYASQRDLGAVKTLFLFDDSLTTQDSVNTRAVAELSRIVGMPTKYTVVGIGFESVVAGKVVTVALPNFSIPSGKYYCMEVVHSAPPSQTTLTLYAYHSTLEDVILDIIKQLRKQRQASLSAAISTRVLRFHELLKLSPRFRVFKRSPGTAFLAEEVSGSATGYGSTASLGRGGCGSETVVYDSGA